ncbi:MAG: ABC transporter permease [Clostridium sp.]|jgi:peptide/nickel transport system permease protein|nr:ABC transporter permease [Clostridium sp.]
MENSEKNLTLNDDARVKSLSPTQLILRRFTRNRLAIVGSVIIIAMFLFSFVGGLITPYGEGQLFTAERVDVKAWAYATENKAVILTAKDPSEKLSVTMKGGLQAALNKGETAFTASDEAYFLEEIAPNSYLVYRQTVFATGKAVGNSYSWTGISLEEQQQFNAAIASGKLTVGDTIITVSGKRVTASTKEEIAIASYYSVAPLAEGYEISYDVQRQAVDQMTEADRYKVVTIGGTELFVSTLNIRTENSNEVIPVEMREAIIDAIENNAAEFEFEDALYRVSELNGTYTIKTEKTVYVVDIYAKPSLAHPLGTDGNGMDVMTRLMYGGRISLMVGFFVILIDIFIGVVLGGIAGYFGKLVDAVIMRLVDIFMCIPTLPLYLIIGAIMEGNKLDAQARIFMLIGIMGFMGWPGTARMVRGQILSLREQEFMVAEEAMGIRATRRIFKHLIPNVIPQLIVIATMGLGDVILAESTLSFLGLGVKYPLASWGNILNSVNDMHVMTSYLYVWIPAGLLILLTVLGFNFVGDGLRDAFDPRAKK